MKSKRKGFDNEQSGIQVDGLTAQQRKSRGRGGREVEQGERLKREDEKRNESDKKREKGSRREVGQKCWV